MKSTWETYWDDALGSVKLEFAAGRVFLHVTVLQPLEAMRKIQQEFPGLKAKLRARGYDKVHVIIRDGDEKLYRFERFFGFEEVRRRGGFVLMAQGC